ncbi:MAG: hypothetical protein ACK583_09820 [Cyanobacteriota bacterium]
MAIHIALPAFSLAMAREWAPGEGKNFGFGFGEAVAPSARWIGQRYLQPRGFHPTVPASRQDGPLIHPLHAWLLRARHPALSQPTASTSPARAWVCSRSGPWPNA